MELSFNIIALLLATLLILVLDLIAAGVAVAFGATFKSVFLKGLWFMLLPWLAWCYGAYVERNCSRIKRVAIQSERLPEAFDGYRIVHISDLHLNSYAGREKALQRVVDKINSLEADMVTITGDLVSHGYWEMDGFEEMLASIKAKDGVYSVLGNHDYSEYYHWPSQQQRMAAIDTLKQRQRAMGWQLLLDENRRIYRGEEYISVVGVENISSDKHFRSYGNLQQALQGTLDEYKVLLSHDPTHWRGEVLHSSDVDLMLAGHTHAMQLSLFGWSPSSLAYDEYRGLYEQDGRMLYVNIGLGETLFRARIGAVPEITLLELKVKR